MATQMCVVCNQCGTHEAAKVDPWLMAPGEWLRALPDGWFVHREAAEVAVWTFCSARCVDTWAEGRA